MKEETDEKQLVQNINKEMNEEKEKLENMHVIDDFINCNTECGGHTYIERNRKDKRKIYNYMYHNIPAFRYVLEKYLNFMFADGLTTGDEETEGEERLQKWLYRNNPKNTTNYNTFMHAVGWSHVFGKAGLRWLSEEDGWVFVSDKNYASVVAPNKEYFGFKEVIAYAITIDPEKDIRDVDLEGKIEIDENTLLQKGFALDEKRGVVFVATNEFVNLRYDTNSEEGESVFNFDLLRLIFIAETYEKLIDDIRYDGPGRILLRVKNNTLEGDDENEVSAGKVMQSGVTNRNAQLQEIIKEIEGIQKKLKNSDDKSVIAISNFFDEIKHLPKILKASEMLNYLKDHEDTIIAQALGITPAVIGVGRLRGNVSLEKIIDNDMLNSIIPKRERYAIQVSQLLSEKLGLPKVFFNKYQMKQIEDNSQEQAHLSIVVERLIKTGYEEPATLIVEKILDNLRLNEDGEIDVVRKHTDGNESGQDVQEIEESEE